MPDPDRRRPDTALTDEENDDRDVATLPAVENSLEEERELSTDSDAIDNTYNDSDLGASTGYTDIHQPRPTEPSTPDEDMDQDGDDI
jgi:hypothetical protein